MVNKVILIGNLGRDPEVRSTPSGQPVANFTLATSRRWRDKNGQKQEQTEWHQVVVWGKQAEIAGQYLTKGKQVFVEGRLETRSWEKDGQKHYRTEVICDQFTMLGGGTRSDGAGRGPDTGGAPEGHEDHGGGAAGGHGIEDDDIPF